MTIKHRGVEPEGIAIADELGVAYDGIFEGLGYQFTDVMETGSSFIANTLKEAGLKLARMREAFARAEKPIVDESRTFEKRFKHELRKSDFMAPPGALWKRFVENSRKLASDQRGAPESAMLKIQFSQISQLYGYVAEHIGDLTNRMSEDLGILKGNFGSVKEKVNRIDRIINDPSGFEEEFKGQIKENLDFLKSEGRQKYKDYNEAYSKLKELGQEYADAHSKLVVMNDAQKTARDAAVALGEFRFDDVRTLLSKLKEVVDKGRDAWDAYALSFGDTIQPSAHPLVIEQYPHGEVPEKIGVSGLEVKPPPLRGEDIGENAAIRTDEKLDKTVEHLGYHSISISNEELANLGRSIPTDIHIIKEAQRRLRETEVIPDNKLSPRQLAHLNLARAIAGSSDKPISGVYAAIIPPASDRVKTAGVYGTQNKAIYISPEILDRGHSTVDTLVHELGHHRQSVKEDLTPEHALAMTSIADNLIIAVNEGSLDPLLKDIKW